VSERPVRIQLRRAKGWRMPANTVKVDRTTPWGNPFVVGDDGTRAECVDLLERLAANFICISTPSAHVDAQLAWLKHAKAHIGDLKGKNLACWCPLDQPCHADVLLLAANQ
jgi:hypothetical protein